MVSLPFTIILDVRKSVFRRPFATERRQRNSLALNKCAKDLLRPFKDLKAMSILDIRPFLGHRFTLEEEAAQQSGRDEIAQLLHAPSDP